MLIGKWAKQQRNLGTKKPQTYTRQATTTLQIVLESTANHMPDKSWTKEDGKKVVAMSLPLSFYYNSTLSEINAANLHFELKEVSRTDLNWIHRELFSKFSTKKRGDNFARCGDCDDLKQMRSTYTRRVGLMMWARRDWICTLRVKERIKSFTMQNGFSQRRSQRSV